MRAFALRLSAWRPFTAIVVGDYMLDEHVFGAAERLSPDAPVPVLHASHAEVRPGGASNVCLCLAALGGRPVAVGVCGDDADGRRLRAALDEAGADASALVADAARPTTVKRSLVGLAQHRHPQKMFRVDVESREPLSAEVEDRVIRAVRERVDAAKAAGGPVVLCLEDYAKGVCTERVCAEVIAIGRGTGVEVLVDPAAIDDFSRYRGATAITPNRSEAEHATGAGEPIRADRLHSTGLAAQLGRELDLEAVVLTLDKDGALLETRGSDPELVPTVARSVYDVTGAGDMVLAALAAARANGMSWRDAVVVANEAAGLEVEHFGVRPIPLAEVQRSFLRRDEGTLGKRRSHEDVAVEVGVHRAAGERVVFTNGCFDVLHAGHVGYLREARGLGDVLVVGVNDDAGVHRLKGEGRPVYPLDDRVAVLSELQCVDYVVPFATPTVEALLRTLRPDVYVKGGDYEPEQVAEYPVVQELGLELRLLANRPGLGSTQTIEKLREIEAGGER